MSGIARTGWGAGCCVGDFDNDGNDDLFVSYWGDCSLWKNLGNGKFVDVAAKAGVTTRTKDGRKRNNTGCAFVDYDRDGHLDLFVANYLEFDLEDGAAAGIGPVQVQGTDWWPAVRRDCRAERTFCSTTTETARSRTCRRSPEFSRRPGTFGLGCRGLRFR